MFVCFNAFLQHFHTINLCRIIVADGGVSAQLFFADVGSRSCRIGYFHNLQVVVARQEISALHQRHGVRVHLRNILPVVLGQTHNAVFDAQLVFSHYGHSAVAKQFIVVQQASGNGILYGHQCRSILILPQVAEHLLEGVAAHQFQLFALKVPVRCYIVEASLDALYCYSSYLYFSYRYR